MGRLRRYRTAFKRYRHGKGFGIHSPFAFSFVLKVLRERLPYYSYARLEALRAMVISRTRHHLRHPRIISLKNAKLIFRVTNFFRKQYCRWGRATECRRRACCRCRRSRV